MSENTANKKPELKVGQKWLCRDGETTATIIGDYANGGYAFSAQFSGDDRNSGQSMITKDGFFYASKRVVPLDLVTLLEDTPEEPKEEETPQEEVAAPPQEEPKIEKALAFDMYADLTERAKRDQAWIATLSPEQHYVREMIKSSHNPWSWGLDSILGLVRPEDVPFKNTMLEKVMHDWAAKRHARPEDPVGALRELKASIDHAANVFRKEYGETREEVLSKVSPEGLKAMIFEGLGISEGSEEARFVAPYIEQGIGLLFGGEAPIAAPRPPQQSKTPRSDKLADIMHIIPYSSLCFSRPRANERVLAWWHHPLESAPRWHYVVPRIVKCGEDEHLVGDFTSPLGNTFIEYIDTDADVSYVKISDKDATPDLQTLFELQLPEDAKKQVKEEVPVKPKFQLKIGQKYRDADGRVWTVERECAASNQKEGYAFLCEESGVESKFTGDGFFWSDRCAHRHNFVELVEDAPADEQVKEEAPTKPKLQLKIGQTYRDGDGDIWVVESECSDARKTEGYAFNCRLRMGGARLAFTEDGRLPGEGFRNYHFVELVEDAPTDQQLKGDEPQGEPISFDDLKVGDHFFVKMQGDSEWSEGILTIKYVGYGSMRLNDRHDAFCDSSQTFRLKQRPVYPALKSGQVWRRGDSKIVKLGATGNSATPVGAGPWNYACPLGPLPEADLVELLCEQLPKAGDFVVCEDGKVGMACGFMGDEIPESIDLIDLDGDRIKVQLSNIANVGVRHWDTEGKYLPRVEGYMQTDKNGPCFVFYKEAWVQCHVLRQVSLRGGNDKWLEVLVPNGDKELKQIVVDYTSALMPTLRDMTNG